MTALMSHRKYRKTLVGHFQIKNKVEKLDVFKAHLNLSLRSFEKVINYHESSFPKRLHSPVLKSLLQ